MNENPKHLEVLDFDGCVLWDGAVMIDNCLDWGEGLARLAEFPVGSDQRRAQRWRVVRDVFRISRENERF